LKLVFATLNRDKIREIDALLKNTSFTLLTLDDFPHIQPIVEDGKTLKQNALKKAKTIFDKTGLLTLADDTGLEVDALNGQPGVFSSRFAGEKATYDENVNKLLALMQNVPDEKRSARFRCVIAMVGSDIEQLVEGVCEGFIIHEKRGDSGFGYDPVFYVPEFKKTFSELDLATKNKISHRGQALKKAIAVLLRIAAAQK